ncbi:MAG: hypothetical protein ACRD1X_01635 [Vicinamibacteria bacterium]
MLFHTAAYVESVAASQTNLDIDAASDDVIQRRNSHLIFSEPFNLLAAHVTGVGLTRMRFGNVALTQRGSNHLWPIHRSATVVSRPQVYDMRDMPMILPTNEEITLEATTDATAGPNDQNVVLWLAKPSWNMNLPQGIQQIKARATVTIVAGAEAAWSTLAAVVMERDLFNGVYAVTGCHVVAANAIAFRIFFPSQPQVEGRQLRPGGLCIDTIGDLPWQPQSMGLGEWGRFHTFELPNIQTLDDTAGGTYEVRLDLVYLGTDVRLLHGG